jgi:hypothetical protein
MLTYHVFIFYLKKIKVQVLVLELLQVYILPNWDTGWLFAAEIQLH